jgi:hypothetical protein
VSPRQVPAAARAGGAIGVFGWLLAFALLTVPESYRFAPQLAGGLVLSLLLAFLVDRVLCRAPRLPLALAGAILLTVAVLGAYWSLVVEPALAASPHTLARLRRLDDAMRLPTIVHLSPRALASAVLFGLPLFLAGWFRHQAKRHGMR